MAMNEVMAGADEVLQGIKRQQVTGIPPKNMETFTIKRNGTGSLKITVKTGHTVVADQVLCTCAGVRVVRKSEGIPQDINDGVTLFVHEGTDAYTYEDNGLTDGQTYYYRAFPFSDHGVYNLNEANVREASPWPIKYWAFDQNFADKAPATTITYPSGYENSGFAAMLTNEGTGTATAGSWASFLEDVLKNFPYMVRKDGTADYMLDPDDYTLKAADGEASDYNNLSYDGGAFAWINKILTREEYSSNGETRRVIFSDGDDGTGDFLPLGFEDGENVLEGIWLPMGYMDANGRTLVAGTTPVASKTCDQEWAIIQAFSERARFLGGPILNLLRDLEYMLFKNTDIQARAGHGRCNAGSQAVVANAVVPNGRVRGWKGTSDQKTMNKYFHSQLLGSYQQLTRDPYTLLIGGKLYAERYYRYNLNATGKTDTGITWPTDSAWQYPSRLQYLGEGLGSFPKHENTGSSSTGLCDGVYGNASGTRVALRLGYTNGALVGGPAFVGLDSEASFASWTCGVGCALLPSAGYAPA